MIFLEQTKAYCQRYSHLFCDIEFGQVTLRLIVLDQHLVAMLVLRNLFLFIEPVCLLCRYKLSAEAVAHHDLRFPQQEVRLCGVHESHCERGFQVFWEFHTEFVFCLLVSFNRIRFKVMELEVLQFLCLNAVTGLLVKPDELNSQVSGFERLGSA